MTISPGMILEQRAAAQFNSALEEYRRALAEPGRPNLVQASLKVHSACRNKDDRATVNRAFESAPGLIYLTVKSVTKYICTRGEYFKVELSDDDTKTEIVGVNSEEQIDRQRVVSVKEGQEDHPLFAYASAAANRTKLGLRTMVAGEIVQAGDWTDLVNGKLQRVSSSIGKTVGKVGNLKYYTTRHVP